MGTHYMAAAMVMLGIIGVGLAAYQGWHGMEAACYIIMGWGIGIYSDQAKP